MEKALTHSSAAARHIDSNERLEFLGDAVLELVVSKYLYEKFPAGSEGELTEMRKILVQGRSLSRMANRIGLKQTMSERLGTEVTSSVLSDTYESLIGAIFLDGGMKAAREFIHRSLLQEMDMLLASPSLSRNYKGEFLEYAQSIGEHPYYTTDHVDGKPHKRIYHCSVWLHSERFGSGAGQSKKEAEQKAAREAIEKVGIGKGI